MNTITKKIIAMAALSMAVSGCSTFSFFDKDNTPPPTPLANFTQTTNIHSLWSTRTSSGSGSELLKLSPAIDNQTIFTSSKDGTVAANDLVTGKSLWAVNTGTDLSTGVAAANGYVYFGTREGELVALQQTNGKKTWHTSVSSEILAPPAEKNGVAIAKTIDGHVTALAAQDGHVLWTYQEAEPSLILRGSSAPQLSDNAVIAGFESGKLVKLGLQSGSVRWKSTVAVPDGLFAIQRMVDIDADPVIVGNRVYAATYQGRISALEINSGNEIWSQDISSYAGIAADSSNVFVSDAKSHVFAFRAANGAPAWEQADLAARTITGPAILNQYVIVGDAEGYLHVLSRYDGHFVARTLVSRSGILAAPIVKNNVVYVYTKDGHLAAYTIG